MNRCSKWVCKSTPFVTIGFLLAIVLITLTACSPATPPPSATTTEPTSSAPAPTTAAPTTAEMQTVSIFQLDMEGAQAGDCSAVTAVTREISTQTDPAGGALTELLMGVTPDEEADGLGSWFNAETEGMLQRVRLEGQTLFVDFSDFTQVIPNASSSCGSAGLLAQLDSTVEAAVEPGVRACYTFDGKPEPFYEWLQLVVSDACTP